MPLIKAKTDEKKTKFLEILGGILAFRRKSLREEARKKLKNEREARLDNNFMREDYRSETLLPKIVTVDIRD